MTELPNKWRCDECDWIGTLDQMLRAPNPFDETIEVCGCPTCHEIDHFSQLCDECEQESTCGFPTAGGGYRRTCSKHYAGKP